MNSMLYIEYPSYDPYFNLALEQHVFDNLDQSKAYFMLWQNHNAIIVGKNQNTVQEINQTYTEANAIKVVRRLSGGGAVYHDMGNLNFTFIMDAANSFELDFELFCAPVAQALKALGVQAELNGRNDITIDGKKFSGNAQYIKNSRVMHHGTIMFNSDLDKLSQALKVSPDKIISKGAKSVSARVTNVADHLRPKVPLQEFKSLLLKNMFKDRSLQHYKLTPADLESIEALKVQRYAAWDWNYGASPPYSVLKQRRVEGCGLIEVAMQVEKGIIKNLHFSGDFFGLEDSLTLAEKFIGHKANEQDYRRILSGLKVNRYFHNLSNEDFITILSQ